MESLQLGVGCVYMTPTPGEIRAVRKAAGLTQTQAAQLIHATLRAWQCWEAPQGTPAARSMHPGLFELFVYKISAIRRPTAID